MFWMWSLLLACPDEELSPPAEALTITGDTELQGVVGEVVCGTFEVYSRFDNAQIAFTAEHEDPSGESTGELTLSSVGWCYESALAGLHHITITVTDPASSASLDVVLMLSASDTADTSIPVDNLPPVAEAGEDLTDVRGEVVRIDGGASSDPEGGDLEFHWEFPTACSASGSSYWRETLRLICTEVGDHTIELTVTDDAGATDTDTMVLTVVDPVHAALVVTTEAPSDTGLSPMEQAWLQPTFTCDASASTAEGALTYTFELVGSDGSVTPVSSTGSIASVTVSATDTASWTVRVTVADSYSEDTATASLSRAALEFGDGDVTLSLDTGLEDAFVEDLDDDDTMDLLLSFSDVGGGRIDAYLGPFTASSTLDATSRVWSVEGDRAGDQLSTVVLLDVDGDGVRDGLFGAPSVDEGAVDGGALFLLSGPLSGTVELSEDDIVLEGDQLGQYLGGQLILLETDEGTQLVVGEDSEVAHAYTSLPEDGDWSDYSALLDAQLIENLGDLDGDGSDDLGTTHSGGSFASVLYGPLTGTYVGADGELSLAGPPSLIAAAGDVDEDGYDDVWVGSLVTGNAWLLSGPVTPGAEVALATLPDGSLPGTARRLDPAVDLDGDGVLDAALGERVAMGPLTGALTAWRSGALTFEATSSGALPRGAPDLNGDGYDDLLWVDGDGTIFFGMSR